MPGHRINQFLASCGLGSRRACEDLVTTGRVAVNGRTATTLGQRVLPGDTVTVDGEPVRPDPGVVIVLNKPRLVLCTRDDPEGRATLYDFLPPEYQSLAHVGRLDRDSEGLIVLTNDGALAHALTHPSSKIDKEYEVHVDRSFDPRDRQRLLDGVSLEDGIAIAHAVFIDRPRELRIILRQGMKRQIRLMLEHLGYNVRRLIRTRIGTLTLPTLKQGRWKRLGKADITRLTAEARPRRDIGAIPAPPTPKPPPAKLRRPPRQGAPAKSTSRPARPPGKSPARPAKKKSLRSQGPAPRPAKKSSRPGPKNSVQRRPNRK